jgi:predicted SprT family Zn-dependent metalloprotease
MSLPPNPTIADLRALAVEALHFWGEPDLEHGLVVEQSERMTRLIAKTYPARRVIRVSTVALGMEPADAHLVMWHESAHIVVFQRYGVRARPHGEEWKSLLASAGLESHVRIADRQHRATSTQEPRQASRSLVYRCPVCQAVAYARRKMPRWVCAVCRNNGLPGDLIVDRCGP